MAPDGTFSLAVSSRDDRAAAVNEPGARATASVRVTKAGPVLTPGTYVVTATITDWQSSNQATDHAGTSIDFGGGVDCRPCNAVTASEGTSEAPGQLTRTTYWVVTETVQTTLFAFVDASAGVGMTVYDDSFVLGSIGSASASASGVFQPITVRPA